MHKSFAIALLCVFTPLAALAQTSAETEKVAGFETLDINGDGVIDANEWSAASRLMAKAPGLGALDADGDGQISPKEWRMWADAGGETPR